MVSYSQVPPYIKPQMPTLDYLTVDLTTGNPTLHWTAPPLDIPLFPNPVGYIIFKYSSAGSCVGFCEYDTTYNLIDLSYTDVNSNANQKRLSYQIASLAPLDRSQKTSTHSNIFVTAKYDSCNHKIDLSWQQYEGWGNRIDSNLVYIGSTSDWTTYTKLYSLAGTVDNASILNVNENQDYWFYIESKKQGSPAYITKSNLLHKFTYMPSHPTSMSIDSILAEDKKINLYFKIDQKTELSTFNIVRWEQPDSILSLYSTKKLHTFSNPSLTYFADTTDSWAARTRPFYYKIDAVNSCPLVVNITNHANSITPVVQNKGMKNIIQWDKLHVDTSIAANRNNTITYRVTRYAYDYLGNQLPPVVFAETTETEITDDVSGFEGQGYSIKFCYQIDAIERNTSGSTVMLSRSRIDCTEIVPGVVMPDAIVPNDYTSNNGNARNILVPIITFQANYKLAIYNRWGGLVYVGENQGWDGKESNGRFAKEGTYIYRLTVYTLGNRNVIRTGSVTVVYR